MGIAREGKPLIVALVVIAIIVQWSGLVLLSVLPALLALILLFVLRDPERKIPAVPLAIVSPGDGVVASVATVHDGFLNREALRIIIHRQLLGVNVMRVPTEGKIIQQWSDPNPGNDESSFEDGGRYAMWIQTDEKDDVVFVHGGFPSTLIKPNCYVHIGERAGQGERCGLAPFGKYIEVYLPVGSKPDVKEGDRLVSGSTIIATLRHG